VRIESLGIVFNRLRGAVKNEGIANPSQACATCLLKQRIYERANGNESRLESGAAFFDDEHGIIMAYALARAGGPEQHLMFVAAPQPGHQLLDGLRLVAHGLERRL
jgi:hypothetical protein